ncbi:DUF3841 domain-containing protein [Planomonospora sp. ID82291]|uniref:DUF3841 domain-containing protein n=1 Tax=Planomonospora sp. ID82291 TaxID=2738136 RepID=UPI0018C40D9B|nr:DUF3841 domain-containing protein [Planomonospora sp. ID82291]MBG0817870.1 DUF3841 domain-containing protein [Planomonospora sp. ID82291]
MRLWTVQHRAVLESLEDAGELVGDWERITVRNHRACYEAMAAEMARRGLDCGGRPPVWAWEGPDTRDNRVALAAELLLCPQTPQEYARYVVLDLDVPDEAVLLSSYGRWNDFMAAIVMGEGPPDMDWSIDRDELNGMQACLARVSAGWVLGSRPLEPFRPEDEPEEEDEETGP